MGLPLSIAFALRGKRVAIFDINSESAARVRDGVMPFIGDGGSELLRGALASGNLAVAEGPEVITQMGKS